jgi:hypothetical protein
VQPSFNNYQQNIKTMFLNTVFSFSLIFSIRKICFRTDCSGWQMPLEKATYQRASIISNNGVGNKGHSLVVMYEISKVRIA